ncbi:MAG: response regulator [Pseudobacteriovorax sp.]|nr:response regulator [Pseudobacteriovorax sp.]
METVLFVEDCEDIREIYEAILTDEGYSVIKAENGREGLRLFHESEPELVLTDVMMPSSTGLDMIRLIRKKDKNVPIIAISGDPEHGKLSCGVGANSFIEKPFSSAHLIKKVAGHLNGSG